MISHNVRFLGVLTLAMVIFTANQVAAENEAADSVNSGVGNPVLAVETTSLAQVLSQALQTPLKPDTILFPKDALMVIGNERGASLLRGNSSIRISMPQSSLVYDGDLLEIPGGTLLQLSLDASLQNILELHGPAKARILSTKPYQILLEQGSLYADLSGSNWVDLQLFTLKTMGQNLRGRFIVQTDVSRTKYWVGEGTADIAGRDFETGDLYYDFGLLKEGNAVELFHPRVEVEQTRPLNYSERLTLESARRRVAATVRLMQSTPIQSTEPDERGSHNQNAVDPTADQFLYY
jgi:hypothetical protein